jgi:hypothetical protein
MDVGGRVRRAIFGLSLPIAGFGVGVLFGARLTSVLSEIVRRLDF